MGTPEFAASSLSALYALEGVEVVGAFTQPDKPVGRKQILEKPPVKLLAEEHGTPVFQPRKLRDGTALDIVRELDPELIAVVAYGRLIPDDILNYPKYGTINIHGSLLPKYRGAAPIQWSVINGEKETGVTIMQMNEGLDTGDMLMKCETDIGENETIDELHDKLSEMGAELIVKVVHDAEKGLLKPEKQDDSKSSYVGMLTKDMMRIDFTKSAKEVHNLVRALTGTAFLGEKRVKIYRTLVRSDRGEAGKILSLSPFVVACGEGAVEIAEIQPEGKKRMLAKDFANGLKNMEIKELKFS